MFSLLFEGLVENGGTIADYHIHNMVTFTVLYKLLKLRVRCIVIPILIVTETFASETIANVKLSIARHFVVPSFCIHLMFAGIVLEDDRTLSYYAIQNGSSLMLDSKA